MIPEPAYQFSNVYIVPQYSEVTSRSEVNTSATVDHLGASIDADAPPSISLNTPVISANMDTVTDGRMALAMWRAGGMGAIHRFMSIEQNVQEFRLVTEAEGKAFVSVGVAGDAVERATALYRAGARHFVIDIAHGHSKMMKDMIQAVRRLGHVYIMAGNVATPAGVHSLVTWGADAVKIGIGPGAVCTTKNVTGVTVPQFSAIKQCCKERYTTLRGFPLVRVADGGIQEIGDIAKALGAGADVVMCGRLLAGCKEAPGPRMNGQKIYRGMASRDAMLTIREEKTLPTPEGVSTLIGDIDDSAADVVKRIKGGLQSAFSYSNARNLTEFQRNVSFGIRA